MPAPIMIDETKAERDHQFGTEALRWLPEVTRFALSLTRDEADADDLVQETYLKAYEYAAKELGVKTKEILLVAAHAWDLAGATAAGCETAFVARPEKVLSPGGREPQFQASDVSALAVQIVEQYG